MLMRIRRYRVFLVFAILLVTVLYHYSFSNEWDSVVPIVEQLRKESAIVHGDTGSGSEYTPPGESSTTTHLQYPSPIQSTLEPISTTSSIAVAEETLVAPKPIDLPTKSSDAPKTIPEIAIPDRKPAITHVEQQTQFDDIHPLPPGRLDPEYALLPTSTIIHWAKQTEHFPVPAESIIELPSGKPINIPKIQHDFPPESAEAKAAREKKRDIIKDEAKRAWASYKKFAWMHDELSPVSGKFRDPFCGWAATLVDSLDTLWIMDMIPEFEEAVKAVDLIDFTTSERAEIPMFETTIRYLGGLLAAYDISEAKYRSLLDKAAELAEILYSAFDTPNRMPILYYQWKPAFAANPHRASTRAGTAELGSMAMEFTRLAQLTKEPRYYDAVARITNALEEFQNQGTGLPGVFPGDFDASGCNWTQPSIPKPMEEPHGYKALTAVTPKQPIQEAAPAAQGPGNLEFQVYDAGIGQSTARIQGWDANHGTNKAADDIVEAGSATKMTPLDRVKRQLNDPSLESPQTAHKSGREKLNAVTNSSTGAALPGPYDGPVLDLPTKSSNLNRECVPQGLVAANRKYSMGGGQDSTYEYFPKQYVLLGGLEDKYRTMYLKVIDAVRQNMLYRPMIPENRSVLFSGAVSMDSFGAITFDAEVTHLTCFIGGMVGMGAKLFNIDSDMEIAKQLTDGCVWSYESMPSGIMPEHSHLLPCESVNNCVWNETTYRESLDPIGVSRDELRTQYFINKELALKAEAEAAEAEAEAARAKAEAKEAEKKIQAAKEEAERLTLAANTAADTAGHEQANRPVPVAETTIDIPAPEDEAALLLQMAEDHKLSSENGPKSIAEESANSLQKRQINMDEETKLSITHDLEEEALKLSKAVQALESENPLPTKQDPSGIEQGKIPVTDEGLAKKLEQTEQELEAQNLRGKAPSSIDPQSKTGAFLSLNTGQGLPREDPMAPFGHEEFIENKIVNEKLPPGYMSIQNRKYILRPEAIESVWYMYRITGDPIWQEKGWRMWLSIMKYTRTEYAHSAILDVTSGATAGDKLYQDDTMESFWLAETLKYFYLLFSEPGLVSLDEWVLNTEAHPFRRPS